MTSRKKPGVAFWATVVVVAALLAHPLSFGPACWLAGDWTPENTLAITIIPSTYYPILWLARFIRRKVAPPVVYVTSVSFCSIPADGRFECCG